MPITEEFEEEDGLIDDADGLIDDADYWNAVSLL